MEFSAGMRGALKHVAFVLPGTLGALTYGGMTHNQYAQAGLTILSSIIATSPLTALTFDQKKPITGCVMGVAATAFSAVAGAGIAHFLGESPERASAIIGASTFVAGLWGFAQSNNPYR